MTNNDFDRPEIVALVPQDAKRVLDLGCGTGRVGAAIKARQECVVHGVDCDKAAIAQAACVLDLTTRADLDKPLPKALLQGERFDCVILADVLEHVRDPLRLLREARALLTDAGTLVVSVPNSRHWSVLLELAEGGFAYEDAGLLDRTHVRLFTGREVQVLLDAAGFAVERQQAIPGPGHDEWVNAGKPGFLHKGRLHIGDLTENDAFECYVYQWLLTARQVERPAWGLTSIVIPVCNNLQFTAQAVRSIRRHTQEPVEIIVVDNGSTDGTAAWAEREGLRLIRNEENRGFPVACNQGIAAAKGQQVLLLNNDVLMTPGWLRRMLECLHWRPQVGMVGPRCNNIKGAQSLQVGYTRIEELDRWSWWWSNLRRGERFPTDFLGGGILLVKAEVLDQIGVFDEQFGLGNWEDDDLCRRARMAGWELWVANDAVVHHYGQQTFASEGIDYNRLLAENREKFIAKWA